MKMHQITPCLWFDTEAEEAAKFYTSVFKNSSIDEVTRYGKEGFEITGKTEGTVMTVAFTINGQKFTALNGGPQFKFSEAISFQVMCETQDEIDYYWNKFTSKGEEGPCGWCKDQFGLSWQVVPTVLPELLQDPKRAERVTHAFMQMKKFDIAELENA